MDAFSQSRFKHAELGGAAGGGGRGRQRHVQVDEDDLVHVPGGGRRLLLFARRSSGSAAGGALGVSQESLGRWAKLRAENGLDPTPELKIALVGGAAVVNALDLGRLRIGGTYF